MKSIKLFIQQQQVLIVSILTALVMVIQQFMQPAATPTDWLAIGYAAGIAVLGAIANAWKGKGLTILGMIGTAAYAIVDIAGGGHFTLSQIILSVFLSLILAALKSLNPNPTQQK